MKRTYVWDLAVRLFHWALVAGFAANALLTDPESLLHRQIGYAIAGLLVFRLVWGLIGSRHARFSDFPPSAGASVEQLREIATRRPHAHAGHSPLGALMIYNLLITLTGIAVTGYMMTTLAWFGIDWVEEAHEMLVTWAEISVVIHIGAVVAESRRLKVNLPRSMVTGYKDLPENPVEGVRKLA